MARPKLLVSALHTNSTLRDHVVSGSQAIESKDLKLLSEQVRKSIGDSVDLDQASRAEAPEDNRWDYIVSSPENELFAGIEPHTAKDSEISVVIAKRKHAIAYLRNHLVHGVIVSRWFWVTHDKVGFSNMEKARRRLDQQGIRFVGGVLKSLK